MEFRFHIGSLILLAEGAAYDREARTLFVADLHIGKSTIFREAGLAIPDGPDETNLARLSSLVTGTKVKTLFILGDVFHARARGVERTLADWHERHPKLRCCVVPGNHDRRIPWREWLPAAEILREGECVGAMRVAHFPPEKSDVLTLCGHLHPGIAIGRPRQRKLRLPCFWQRRNALVLPAFGEFTGLQIIDREPGDQVWIPVGGMVAEVAWGNRDA